MPKQTKIILKSSASGLIIHQTQQDSVSLTYAFKFLKIDKANPKCICLWRVKTADPCAVSSEDIAFVMKCCLKI